MHVERFSTPIVSLDCSFTLSHTSALNYWLAWACPNFILLLVRSYLIVSYLYMYCLFFFDSYHFQAIRRNNAAGIATTNVTDIPPDLVNPGAVELVLDIRREYAKKLEQVFRWSNLS